MTFLSKLGAAIAQGIAIVTGVWPLVSGLFGSKAKPATAIETTVVNDLTQIGQIVTSTEALLGPGTGPQKLAKAGPLIYNVLTTSEAFAGHKVANPTAALAAATALGGDLADFMNALSPDTVQTTGKPLPAPTPTPSTGA